MSEKEMWEEFLKKICRCYPDSEGNMPCDYGVLCDRCATKQADKEWELFKASHK